MASIINMEETDGTIANLPSLARGGSRARNEVYRPGGTYMTSRRRARARNSDTASNGSDEEEDEDAEEEEHDEDIERGSEGAEDRGTKKKKKYNKKEKGTAKVKRPNRRFIRLPNFHPIPSKTSDIFVYHPNKIVPVEYFKEMASSKQGIEIYVPAEYLQSNNINVVNRIVFGGNDYIYSCESDIVAILFHIGALPYNIEDMKLFKNGLSVIISVINPPTIDSSCNASFYDGCFSGASKILSRCSSNIVPGIKLCGIELGVSKNDENKITKANEQIMQNKSIRKMPMIEKYSDNIIQYDNLFIFDKSFEPLQVYNVSALSTPVIAPWATSKSQTNNTISNNQISNVTLNENKMVNTSLDYVNDLWNNSLFEYEYNNPQISDNDDNSIRIHDFVYGNINSYSNSYFKSNISDFNNIHFMIHYFIQKDIDNETNNSNESPLVASCIEHELEHDNNCYYELCPERYVRIQEYLSSTEKEIQEYNKQHNDNDLNSTEKPQYNMEYVNSLFVLPTNIQASTFRFSKIKKNINSNVIQTDTLPYSNENIEVLESNLQFHEIEFGYSTIWIRGRPYRNINNCLYINMKCSGNNKKIIFTPNTLNRSTQQHNEIKQVGADSAKVVRPRRHARFTANA